MRSRAGRGGQARGLRPKHSTKVGADLAGSQMGQILRDLRVDDGPGGAGKLATEVAERSRRSNDQQRVQPVVDAIALHALGKPVRETRLLVAVRIGGRPFLVASLPAFVPAAARTVAGDISARLDFGRQFPDRRWNKWQCWGEWGGRREI